MLSDLWEPGAVEFESLSTHHYHYEGRIRGGSTLGSDTMSNSWYFWKMPKVFKGTHPPPRLRTKVLLH